MGFVDVFVATVEHPFSVFSDFSDFSEIFKY
jgi:hypothetical protein